MEDSPDKSSQDQVKLLKSVLKMLRKAVDNPDLTPKQVKSLSTVNQDLLKMLIGQSTPKQVQDSLDKFNKELSKTLKMKPVVPSLESSSESNSSSDDNSNSDEPNLEKTPK